MKIESAVNLIIIGLLTLGVSLYVYGTVLEKRKKEASQETTFHMVEGTLAKPVVTLTEEKVCTIEVDEVKWFVFKSHGKELKLSSEDLMQFSSTKEDKPVPPKITPELMREMNIQISP